MLVAFVSIVAGCRCARAYVYVYVYTHVRARSRVCVVCVHVCLHAFMGVLWKHVCLEVRIQLITNAARCQPRRPSSAPPNHRARCCSAGGRPPAPRTSVSLPCTNPTPTHLALWPLAGPPDHPAPHPVPSHPAPQMNKLKKMALMVVGQSLAPDELAGGGGCMAHCCLPG